MRMAFLFLPMPLAELKTKQDSSKLEVFIFFFLFIFICVITPQLPGHESDKSLWILWTQHIYNNGLHKAYYSGTDYLPLYQYFLFFFGKIQGSAENISENINYLRCITLAFDFLGIWYVYKWVDKRISYFLLALFSILNIAYSYNTILWGQVDGILTTMVFASLYYAWKKKMIASSIWLILAINFKLQAIVFIPVWGLLYLHVLFERRTLKAFLFPLITMAFVQLLILLPFMRDENGLSMIWQVVTNSVGKYPRVSMNAFNFWHLVIYNPWDTTDDVRFMNISYKTIGLILFFCSSLICMLPLLKNVFTKRNEQRQIDKQLIWLTCSLISILFFFFNTQMHERYCHPAFIFITAYAFYSTDFIPYIIFSIAYFLNMENVLQVLKINNYSTFIFERKLIAILFLIAIVILIIWLFNHTKKSHIAIKGSIQH